MVEKTIENHKNFRIGDYVAVTINPSNRYQYGTMNISRRLQRFRSHMLLVLGPLKRQHKFKFNIEISKFGRLHLHGYVKLSEVLAFSNWVYQTKYNSSDYHVDIDSIDKLSKWVKYCRKDEEVMLELDTDPRIIYPNPHESILQKIHKVDEKANAELTSDDDTSSEDST